MHTVLLIEDNPGDARLIREMLAEEPEAPFALHCAERLQHGLEQLSAGETVLVLLDLSLPDSFGLETFAKVYAHSPTVPIIVLTGNDDQTVALSAVKGGAQDFLVKGRLDRELLLRSMQYSIERKRYQVQLEHQANYDAVTGLPNRNLLHDRPRQAVYAQRVPRAIAVVFIDLDHFKFVNDSLGHSTGDKLLKGMADRLRGVLREGDTVARLGGDEFVLILNDQSNEEVIFRAMQRIAAQISQPMDIDGKEQSPAALASASPAGRPDVDTLLKNADAAITGQGARPQQLPVLHLGDERARQRALRSRTLCRALERRSSPALPAESTCARARSAPRRWCAGCTRVGPGAPGALHPARRGDHLIAPLGEWVRARPAADRARIDQGLARLRRSTCRRASSARRPGAPSRARGDAADPSQLEMSSPKAW